MNRKIQEIYPDNYLGFWEIGSVIKDLSDLGKIKFFFLLNAKHRKEIGRCVAGNPTENNLLRGIMRLW